MKPLAEVAALRDRAWEAHGGSPGTEQHACFAVPNPDGPTLRAIRSRDCGWDHVSVSLEHRTPTWAEMELVKHALFRTGEVAMQLHVPRADHINFHPFCLHLWRPLGFWSIPLPPGRLVL